MSIRMSRLLRPGAPVILSVLFSASLAQAQVGTGWEQYTPPSSIQLDGSNGIESSPGTVTSVRNEGASYTFENGIETFALHDPISNRCERRMQNTYTSGQHQFEGEVRVSPPTDDESVMQLFGGNSGATTQMIRAYNVNGGTLRKVPGSVLLAENVHGTWVKVNMIHDVAGNFVRTYINGRLMATGDGEATGAGNDGWYHKYGCYGTLRTGSAKVEWRNVKHFRNGMPPSGNMPQPPADGGVRPPADGGAAPDAAGPEGGSGDASGGTGSSGGSTGGSGGSTGGSGGSTGTGGSSVTGGSGGGAGDTGGSSTTGGTGGGDRGERGGTGGGTAGSSGQPADPAPAGCSCNLSPGAPAGGWLIVPALVGLLVARRRRR
jgi:MYXO-CTERM domain-containing protein